MHQLKIVPLWSVGVLFGYYYIWFVFTVLKDNVLQLTTMAQLSEHQFLFISPTTFFLEDFGSLNHGYHLWLKSHSCALCVWFGWSIE